MISAIAERITLPGPANIEVRCATAIVPTIDAIRVRSSTVSAHNVLHIDNQIVGERLTICVTTEVACLTSTMDLLSS